MKTEYKDCINRLNDAWNSHKLDEILEFYSDDFKLYSPSGAKMLGLENGLFSGKKDVGQWWQRVLDKLPDLSFETLNISLSSDEKHAAWIFKSSHSDKTVVSIFTFNEAGKICHEYFFE
ncbi:MAG: nuclear transport factor 2 family protein [Spirochaetes bacterium]|nr:nuclear transport factor 2 family protein [Spirochaetota bacterium]